MKSEMTATAAGQPAAQSGKKEKRVLKRTHKRIIFYTLMMILPMLNFLVFYVYQNFSTIFLAFKEYELVTGEGYKETYTVFNNFKIIFRNLAHIKSGLWDMIFNSFVLFLVKTGLGLGLAIVFSYYIYKKAKLSELYRVMLFLPSVISSVILVVVFKYMVENVYTGIFGAKFGLLTTHYWGCILFFNVFISFGTNVLMFSGAMSAIDESIVEAAKIDGANVVQEFFRITLPMVFPTLVTFLVIGLSLMFTDQANLYTFSQESAGESTVGYFLYIQSLQSDVVARKSVYAASLEGRYLSFPEVSAFGLLITAIILPTTLGVRKICEKYGPSEG